MRDRNKVAQIVYVKEDGNEYYELQIIDAVDGTWVMDSRYKFVRREDANPGEGFNYLNYGLVLRIFQLINEDYKVYGP